MLAVVHVCFPFIHAKGVMAMTPFLVELIHAYLMILPNRKEFFLQNSIRDFHYLHSFLPSSFHPFLHSSISCFPSSSSSSIYSSNFLKLSFLYPQYRFISNNCFKYNIIKTILTRSSLFSLSLFRSGIRLLKFLSIQFDTYSKYLGTKS